MLEIHPALLIYQIAVFLIFVFLMYLFVYKRVMKVITERQEKIKNEIEKTEINLKDAEVMKEEYSGKLATATAEASDIIKDAEYEANKMVNEIISKAKDEALSIVEKAIEESKEEHMKVMEDITEKTVDFSMMITKKILQQKIDEKMDRKLAEKFIEELGSMDWTQEK